MYYSQKDPKWANEKLGTCKDTLAQSACYITSGCNLAKVLGTKDVIPPKLNKWLKENAGYIQGCLLITPKMAEYLGLVYKGKVAFTNTRYCIAETDHYRKYGVPQHFFVMDNATKKRLDPLDLAPNWEPNDYHIVSYRLFDVPTQSTKVVEEVESNSIAANTSVMGPNSVATSIPVMGETTTTAVPVRNAPQTSQNHSGEAQAPEGGTGTPPPEIADSVAPKEMTILERLIESIIKFVKAWKGR